MSYNLGQEEAAALEELNALGALLWKTLLVNTALFLCSVVFNFQKPRIFVNCFDLQ